MFAVNTASKIFHARPTLWVRLGEATRFMPTDRRRILLQAAALGGAATLAACSRGSADRPLRWHMVTTWPANAPGFGTAAKRLAALIESASNGRLRIAVHAGDERVAPFEVFDAVARGTAQMGHGAAHYWQDKAPAAPFFATVPFGLNAQEMNGWLQHGGGMELWRELYAPFGVRPFAVGNTGVQTAGWYNREITSVNDLRGLKIRMPGLGGEVMRRLGAIPVQLDGGAIFAALKTGTIDAAEWVGPANDQSFGLHRVAKYCYYPGWQEPGTTLECIVNNSAFEGLSEDLKLIVEMACRVSNNDLLAEFTTRNQRAVTELVGKHGVIFRQLPDTVLDALRRTSHEVLDRIARHDAFAQRVYADYKAYRDGVRAWHAISEVAFYQARS